MKSKLLKFHDAIIDLSRIQHIFFFKDPIDKNFVLVFHFYDSFARSTTRKFDTEKDVMLILDKCYEIMKS